MYAKLIEGAETEASGHYCDGLVDAILRGLCKEARVRDLPGFVQHKNFTYYVHLAASEALWGPILDELEKRFSATSKRPFNISTTDPPHSDIENLIPWELSREQASWAPSHRRFPTDVPFTHRGSFLRLS